LYKVPATEIIRLLQQNIGGDIHIADFLITRRFKMCTELGGRRLVPSHEGMKNAGNDGVKMLFWMQCSDIHTQV
jgi:hypothetical protein